MNNYERWSQNGHDRLSHRNPIIMVVLWAIRVLWEFYGLSLLRHDRPPDISRDCFQKIIDRPTAYSFYDRSRHTYMYVMYVTMLS